MWTIDRILRRAGVAKRRARGRYVPKGTPYPAGRVVVRPGARQEIDLVGPRYLASGPNPRSDPPITVCDN